MGWGKQGRRRRGGRPFGRAGATEREGRRENRGGEGVGTVLANGCLFFEGPVFGCEGVKGPVFGTGLDAAAETGAFKSW